MNMVNSEYVKVNTKQNNPLNDPFRAKDYSAQNLFS